jgi:hypothetical protein
MGGIRRGQNKNSPVRIDQNLHTKSARKKGTKKRNKKEEQKASING